MSDIIERPSPNHDARTEGQPVDILLLHYTGMTSAAAALERLCDPAAEVSAHYCIDEDGSLYRLVPEARRAWHAGVAHWAGATNINARSIGIELVNPGHEFGYRPFPEPQMRRLIALARDILARHPIPPGRVLGHSDVAPARKEDPGELFDWARLAAAGVGLWPQETIHLSPHPIDEDGIRDLLKSFGYDVGTAPLKTVLTAFQRHFQPQNISGVADSETGARLVGLLACLDVESDEA